MSDIWLPDFERRRLSDQPTGGRYDIVVNPKVGWHTWESLNWGAAESAFRRYPPHLAVFPPWPGEERHVGRRQYVPLNRHAYAFSGSESDDEYIVQIEVAGFARHMRDAPEVVLRWLAYEVVAPIQKVTSVPRTVVRFGFHDEQSYKPKREGNYLASERSEIRLTHDELRAFSGHLGHQHMPPPDKHWDPGALPIRRLLSYLPSHLGEGVDAMPGVFRDDDDARRTWVREKYLELFIREPESVAAQNLWVMHLLEHGADATLAALADSEEGKDIRKKKRTRLGV